MERYHGRITPSQLLDLNLMPSMLQRVDGTRGPPNAALVFNLPPALDLIVITSKFYFAGFDYVIILGGVVPSFPKQDTTFRVRRITH